MIPFDSDRESQLLDLVPAHGVVIDRSGKIVHANRWWKLFGAQNGLSDPDSCVGRSYLEECARASERGARGAAAVGEGLRRVVDGTADVFKLTYRCHGPTEARWFQIVATPLGGTPVDGALILHLNVTHQRLLAQRFARRIEYRKSRVVVCAWCRRVRNRNDWMPIEDYFATRYRFAFSHGICPECQGTFRV